MYKKNYPCKYVICAFPSSWYFALNKGFSSFESLSCSFAYHFHYTSFELKHDGNARQWKIWLYSLKFEQVQYQVSCSKFLSCHLVCTCKSCSCRSNCTYSNCICRRATYELVNVRACLYVIKMLREYLKLNPWVKTIYKYIRYAM